MAVRVAGPARVMPHHRSLELLDRNLHLPTSRTDPGGGVLGQPADDLGRRLVLGGVVRGGDLRVQCGGQRPGLRTVDYDLDESQPPLVPAEPTLRSTAHDVEPGNPAFVGRPIQRSPCPDRPILAKFPRAFPRC